MFIVFGWGRQTVKKHGPVYKLHCDHCKNDEYWQLYSKKTWFTLFFIPVIPYETENLILCPICSYGVKLDNDKFREFKAVAECNMDLINKRITQEEHTSRIKALSSGNTRVESNVPEVDLTGKTETQINYIRQMQEIEREREEREKSTKGNEED